MSSSLIIRVCVCVCVPFTNAGLQKAHLRADLCPPEHPGVQWVEGTPCTSCPTNGHDTELFLPAKEPAGYQLVLPLTLCFSPLWIFI